MGKDSLHIGEQPTTQNQNNAMSDDPADGHRLTDNPEGIKKTPVEQPPERDQQNQATIEELGREGLGIAAKE